MNNYIKYLQAGGAAPVNDTQSQITALVEAAMSGDQKAVKQIEQIMQAAQQGNQEAQQIAGLIQQVAEQLQGSEVPQEENGGSVPKAQIGTALFNLGRKAINRFRGKNTETAPMTAPSVPKVHPEMTRADYDFSNQVNAANSDYNTYTDPGDGSYETGRITIPQNGYDIYRLITHHSNSMPSDTTYYKQVADDWNEQGKPIAYRRSEFSPTPRQRDIIDQKLNNTPTSNLYKCGGKVKKGEKGLPIPAKKVAKNAKGGCPCQLKKVGGKLVEVDSCTGKIVK